jgi:flagellar M-ring protein FliF
MVASSIPNMTSSNVTVVDHKGRLLTQSDRDMGIAMSDTQLEYTQKLEQTYIRRIEDILSPIVGLDGVRAQVVAEVDFTITEQTNESYNPDTAVVRSEQIREENRVGVSGPVGVPGALTNQPPGAGAAPEEAVTGDGAQTEPVVPGSNSKNSTRNFEMDRTISHTRVAPGSVRKLSVAVLVDERRSLDAEGNVESTPLSESEMTRINALIMDAIGFNKARGDSLNIVNAPFMAPTPAEPLPEQPIWEQPWLWDIVKQTLGGLLVLFLVFGVIRPAFRDMNKVPVSDNDSASGQDGDMTPEQVAAMAGAEGQSIEQIATGSPEMDQQLDNVKSLVQQDPALVAQVVKNWTESGA